jgi:selenocysteine lyase/cysteine desulfurase
MMQGIEDVTVNGLYHRRSPEAMDALSAFLGCDRDELVFTHSTTEGINMMVWGVALKAGDEVIISEQEHVGNATPWMHRAKIDGLKIKTVACGSNAQHSLDLIKKAITPKTKVIALPHIPCTNGQVLPLKEICALAKTKNIMTCIDGAHGTGMLQLNLREIGVDFYASCCHKWLMAAQGTGYLYINKNMSAKLSPTFIGAEGTTKFVTIGAATLVEKTDYAQRFQFGTRSGALAASITEAILFQNSIGRKNIETYVKQLSTYTANGLKEFKNQITILTPLEEQSKAGIMAFKFNTKNNKQFYETCLSKNIMIRYVAENDINSIRVSTHIYNTKEQVDALLDAVKKHIG